MLKNGANANSICVQAFPPHLLGRNVKRHSSQVDAAEVVHAGQHEEYSRALNRKLENRRKENKTTEHYLGSSLP